MRGANTAAGYAETSASTERAMALVLLGLGMPFRTVHVIDNAQCYRNSNAALVGVGPIVALFCLASRWQIVVFFFSRRAAAYYAVSRVTVPSLN